MSNDFAVSFTVISNEFWVFKKRSNFLVFY